MDAFFIGLQFLTRLHVVKQTVWTEESFGKSVRYFPLVGLVLGLCYAGAAYLLFVLPEQFNLSLPVHIRAVVLAVLPILLTGGIHCDGIMDTVDGIFSGRSRERMLEIMKDSCSGSFGVVAFGIFLLLEYGAILDMPLERLTAAMLLMPVLGRLMMVAAISLYPYARPEGMGKAFAAYANPRSFWLVFAYTLCLVVPFGWQGIFALCGAGVFTHCFARYVVGLLGGLTGDVYGAVCTLSELIVLLVYLCDLSIIHRIFF